jgi:hypothetical protein
MCVCVCVCGMREERRGGVRNGETSKRTSYTTGMPSDPTESLTAEMLGVALQRGWIQCHSFGLMSTATHPTGESFHG